MNNFLETLSGAPEPLSNEIKTKLDALRQTLQRETPSQPFAAVALNRLQAVDDRAALAREIQAIQDAREFKEMSGALQLELAGLQSQVETMAETGVRTLEQQVIQPTNEAIDKLPAWAKLSILGLGVGSTLYAGYSFVKSLFKKLTIVLAGVAIGGLGAVGLGYYFSKKDAAASPETPAETPTEE